MFKSFKYLSLAALFTTMKAQDSNSQAEDVLSKMQALGLALSGEAYPSGAYEKLVPALQSLRESSDNIGTVGPYLLSGAYRDTGFNLTEAIGGIKSSDNAFGETEETLSAVFKSIGQDQCFQMFSSSDDVEYAGWYLHLYNFESPSYYDDYQQFCSSGIDLNFFIDQIIELLDEGGQCDALQALFNGADISQEYAGWRDNILDKAAYLLIDLFQLINVASACDGSQYSISDYSTQFGLLIDRILYFDALAQSSISSSILVNLHNLLAKEPVLSLSILGVNKIWFIDRIYPYVNWIIISMWANQAEGDSYLECSKCADVEEGQYRVIADWYSQQDAISSVANIDFSDYIDLEDSSPEDVYNMIVSDTGACFGGILIAKAGTPIDIQQNIGSIYTSARGSAYDIYAWGSESDCASSNNSDQTSSSSSMPQP